MNDKEKRKVRKRIDKINKEIQEHRELIDVASPNEVQYNMIMAEIEGLKTERTLLRTLLE